jgi:hypothetical protein
MPSSRLADAKEDGPANESDINRMIKMDKYFSLCILFGSHQKHSIMELKLSLFNYY